MNAHANCSRVNPLYRKNPVAANGAAARMHTQLAVSPAERPFRQKVGANGRRNSQHRTDELPGGQAKRKSSRCVGGLLLVS